MLFDVTLNGYESLCAEDKCEQADELVKWVSAPSRESLNAFLKLHDLSEDVESITEIQSQGYTHEDGVDLFVNEQGEVVSFKTRGYWRDFW